jgi:hypothetical protein
VSARSPAYHRFIGSLNLGIQEMRDGIGYDVEALETCTVDERHEIETLLLRRGIKDWRDLEALHALGTPRAKAEIRAALKSTQPDLRLHAAERLDGEPDQQAELEAAIIYGLDQRGPAHSLVAVLEAAARHPTAKVKEALFGLAKHGEGWGAGQAAALLLFLHGLSTAPFRAPYPELLAKIVDNEKHTRRVAFEELCRRIGVNPANHH